MSFNFPFRNKPSSLDIHKEKSNLDSDFLKATNLYKRKISESGISLEDLSSKTKISKSVLKAIKNGWIQNLPEKTYLISMLKKLETELNLEKGELNGISNQRINKNKHSVFEFKFINIDILNSWVGSLLYIIFMLLSILALNIQQKYLIKINTQTSEPVYLNNQIINK